MHPSVTFALQPNLCTDYSPISHGIPWYICMCVKTSELVNSVGTYSETLTLAYASALQKRCSFACTTLFNNVYSHTVRRQAKEKQERTAEAATADLVVCRPTQWPVSTKFVLYICTFTNPHKEYFLCYRDSLVTEKNYYSSDVSLWVAATV